MGGLKMKEDLRVVKNDKKILKEYEDELGY